MDGPILGRDLDALAAAGRGGLVLTLVLVEPQFGAEVLLKHGDLHRQLGNNVAANPDFLPGGWSQKRRLAGQGRDALDRDGAKHAANVVRVKAAPSAEIEFGLEPGAEDEAAFRLEQGLGRRPAEAGRQTMVAG